MPHDELITLMQRYNALGRLLPGRLLPRDEIDLDDPTILAKRPKSLLAEMAKVKTRWTPC